MLRINYFLQLKLDVVEGRLRANCEQAIVLASYALQAEFGDHDTDKHTAEYLQDFPLLPKPLMSSFPDERLGKEKSIKMTNVLSCRWSYNL